MSHYGVPIIRGTAIKLSPHSRVCSLSDLKSYASKIKRPVALDVFCGAGGLSLGLQAAGFSVVLGMDRCAHAVETHRAHFGGVSLCDDLSKSKPLREVCKSLKGVPVALIAGGPPCQPFSRAGKNKIRSLQRGADSDTRRDLWRRFVHLVEELKPQALLIENVPDLGFGENSIVFRRIVNALEAAGYNIDSRVLSARHFGVPQHRQRLFIVGFRRNLVFRWPRKHLNKQVTVRDAICDLPRVLGGGRQIEMSYSRPRSPYQRSLRRGLRTSDKKKIYDHLTRPVRNDDLKAFRLMKHGTLYSQLPARLRRYRSDIFDDKYKRLPWDGLSRSITAHIGRDGYWYIHPDQHRTLTIREAARIQSFPDRFRFAGTPSHAFRQIGEAVPPLLAKALGKQVCSALKGSESTDERRPSTHLLAKTLVSWFDNIPTNMLIAPWRRSRNIWQVLLGMTLCSGCKTLEGESLWQSCVDFWPNPKRFLNDKRRVSRLRYYFSRAKNSSTLTKIAKQLLTPTSNLALSVKTKNISGISSRFVQVAFAMSGLTCRRPVTATAARIAGRVFGEILNGSRIQAELLIGRVVGVDETGRGYAALHELGDRFCKITNPNCRTCPFGALCSYSRMKKSITKQGRFKL